MSTPRNLIVPGVVRALTLETSRGPLAVLDATPDDDTERAGTAVLVPGYTGSKEDFLPLLGPLAARGWRVVALDLPGQHESPHYARERYRVDELGADVLAVVEALDVASVHLVGHSFGGLVVRAAVLQDVSGVASVSLLCSGPAAIPGLRAERLSLLLTALASLDLATIWGVMEELDAQSGLPSPPPEVQAFLRRRFVGNDPVALSQTGEELLDARDRVDDLATILSGAGVPVLVAHGEGDDAWTHASQAEMARRLGAPYVVIPGAAHSPAVEEPAETVALLHDFWQRAAEGREDSCA